MTDALRQYISTALWSSADLDGEPIETNYTADDIEPISLARMESDLGKILFIVHKLLPDIDDTDVAHDFWLSRNGHGSGFFDGFKQYGRYCDVLQEIAHLFGEQSLVPTGGNHLTIYE